MNRNAPRCILGAVVVAVFLAITWSTTSARLSTTTNTTAVEAAASLDPASPSAGGAILIDSAPNVRLEAIQDPVSQDPVSSSGMSPLAKAAGNLDQARNGSATSPTTPIDWVNGNAGASNSHYREGYSIPYRLVLTNLAPGPHNVKIEWDIRNNGKNAIDYITQFNRLNSPNHQAVFQHPAEVIDPTGAAPGSDPSDFISGLGAPTATAIPTPSSVGSSSPGQPGNSFGLLETAGETGMTSYLATAVSLSYDFQGSLSAASSSTRLNIDFTGSGTVVFAWGGHIASQGDWGAGNSASAVSGSPYHTRLISLDGAGGNQDRSLSAAAVIVDCATCSVGDPTTAECGTQKNHTATITAASNQVCDNPQHSWSLVGTNSSGATIPGSTTGPSVTVNVGNACSGEYVVRDTITCSGCTTGSTIFCDQKVTVSDTTAPTVATTPPDQTIDCPAPIVFGSPTFSDNCDTNLAVTFVDTTLPFSCPTVNKVRRTWTARDDCNNFVSTSQTITVVDNTAPSIGSPGGNATIQCPATPAFTPPTTASDSCSSTTIIEVSDVTTQGSCAGSYSQTKTWKARDACGNLSGPVSQTITVEDKTAPVISTLPEPTTIQCTATPSFATPTATDACDPSPTLTFADVTTPGSCPQTHDVTRTWTATDHCGNSSTASQTIHVVDTTAPVISTLPEPTTIECPAAPSFATPTATDACDPSPTLTFADVTTPGSCAHDVTRTWTATDHCGNSSTASQTIHVVDTTAPVISALPEPTTIQCTATPSFATPTATDACDPSPTLTFADVTTPGSCPQARDVTRTWTATDHCGNSSTASQTIHVVDTTAPVISTLPEPTTIECPAAPSFATPTATDACDPSPTLTFADVTTPGSCAHDVTRTWTATDHCGNSSTASQTIHVVDTTAPVLSGCPATEATATCLSDVPPAPTVTASDNCEGNLVVHFEEVTTNKGCNDGACGGIITRTWTAADSCGHSTSCTQMITYGTPGSAQSAQQVAIASLLKSGDLVVGLPGRSLTIPGGDNARASAACLVSKLGASGSTSALPDFGDKTLDSATCQTSPPMDLQEDGTWRNALLSRAITLALNLRLDAQQQLLKQQAQTSGLSSRPDAGFELASLALSSTFWTQGVLPGPDGLVGTSDDELDLSSARMQIMLPTSVLSGLAPGATVADLLKLANAALAGQRTGDVSLSDITAAVDAINRGFDFGRRRLLNSSEK